ncbi:histidinol-phosphatase [Arenibaculum pallidiluteum]|uniref:histidinol-phosphatase n=1 Tax=Arenibaculum pallidiluteum TaxID=2812559 RepID=UPI001A95C8EC|nr:histidinol-phosphatase [Arenibaculum pallidiluteum]
MQEIDELAAFAETMAEATRPVIGRYFRQALAVETKPDESPVTVADRTVEELLRRMVRERHPDHGILGEEYGREGLDSRHVWVIDPIDGTKSFITGMPLFGTLIALLEDRRPVLGVIEVQPLRERWLGVAGRPTTLNGRPCRTSGCTRIEDASLYATSPDAFQGGERDSFERVSRRARLRRFGGDCYAYGLLAAGFVDAVVETGLQPYDYLPLVSVIEGAGGVITDWQGCPPGIGSDGRIVAAATAALHETLLDAL